MTPGRSLVSWNPSKHPPVLGTMCADLNSNWNLFTFHILILSLQFRPKLRIDHLTFCDKICQICTNCISGTLEGFDQYISQWTSQFGEIFRGHCWCSGVLVLELKQCLCCLPFMLDAWFVYSSLEMSDCETQVLQWFGDWALCGGKKYLRLCFCPARPLGWFIKLRQRMTNCTPHYNIQDLISRSLSSCFILDLGCLTVCTK